MRYLILCLALFLGACDIFPKKPDVPIYKPIRVEATLLEECPTLDTKPIIKIDDVLLENISLYEQYAVCSKKQSDSVRALKEITNATK
jgi:hypothetical protein